ncbi:MAG: (Fe-S)-binding protein [Promethearchaeota archaeon]|nr:MAG: (Fe-S)-binding protein [Candidatus Lokiarchaeota archaeon]
MGLEAVKDWIHQCSRCSSCKYIYRDYNSSCPSGEKFWFETFWASGRVWMAKGIVNGDIDWSDSLIRALYACPLCGNCSIQCKQDVSAHLLDIFEAFREEAVKAGKGPLPVHKTFADGIQKENNPYNEPHKSRLDWLGDLDLPKTAEVLYYVGCTSSYRQKEIAQATFSLLKKLNVNFTISPGEWCCTSPLLRTGQTAIAAPVVRHNLAVLQQTEAKIVIFSCAGCYRTFKEDYPKILGTELNAEVLHVTEFLLELLKNGTLRFTRNFPHKITYHDPCHMGRHVGVYDAPRELLKSVLGLELIEMPRNRENAWCCGAGGGVKSGFKDWAIDISKDRVREAEHVDAEYLVSTCPFCYRNLEDAITTSQSRLKMLDVTQILNSVID